MSDPVRGRVMIINNERFFRNDGRELTEATRDGSYIDYVNIKILLKDMGFVVANEDDPLFDLSKQVTESNYIVYSPQAVTNCDI